MLRHNDALRLLGACPCPCGVLPRSAAARAACWCDPRPTRPVTAEPLTEQQQEAARAAVERLGGWWEPPAIAHNDAVHALGGCGCGCHTRRAGDCRCRQRTDPRIAAALRRAEQRRLATGRARPAEYLRRGLRP